MPAINRQTNLLAPCYFFCKCESCNQSLRLKAAIGKRNQKRYCIPCALALNLVTIKELHKTGYMVKREILEKQAHERLLYKKEKLAAVLAKGV